LISRFGRLVATASWLTENTMNLNMKDAALWLGVVCLSLLPLPPLSAQQPRLRDTLGAGHADDVLCVAFAPDGKTLASGSKDTTIKLWDVASEKVTATFKGDGRPVNSVAFSPDGKTLASGEGERAGGGRSNCGTWVAGRTQQPSASRPAFPWSSIP
jgi:hypothetical protein